MFKGLIVDLDNCVFDTKSMGQDVILPVLEALEKSGGKEVFFGETLRKIKQELWSFSLEDLIAKYEIDRSIANQMRMAYQNLEAPLWSRCYEDVDLLAAIKLPKILVTSGYTKLQWSKIRVTGIESLFDEIIIEANDDPTVRKGKRAIFAELKDAFGWLSREIMVIGDNAYSELKAGKELGMITVQTLRPQVFSVPGFDHYVRGFQEIIEILNQEECD